MSELPLSATDIEGFFARVEDATDPGAETITPAISAHR